MHKIATWNGRRHFRDSRQGAMFVIGGTAAFAIDAAILLALSNLHLMPPSFARIPAIAGAMVFGWLWHRAATFSVQTEPTAREFTRFASVSVISAISNYVIYLGLLEGAGLTPFWALFASSLIVAIASFFLHRSYSFRPTSGVKAPAR